MWNNERNNNNNVENGTDDMMVNSSGCNSNHKLMSVKTDSHSCRMTMRDSSVLFHTVVFLAVISNA